MSERRAKITSSSVDVSFAGKDVITANAAEKKFSAADRSLAILRATVPTSLNSSIGSTTTIYYGKTYTKPPMSAIFISPSYPSSSGPFYVVSGVQSATDAFYMIDWALNTGGYVAAATGTTVRRMADRIEMTNWQSGDSAATLYGFSGWVWAVVFDYE